jgi:hypothetical protein
MWLHVLLYKYNACKAYDLIFNFSYCWSKPRKRW